MVNDKFQVRTTGPVHNLTMQPVKGRKRHGGIRLGEMERDSLLAHGTSFLLQDRLMNCSDYSQVKKKKEKDIKTFVDDNRQILNIEKSFLYLGTCLSIMWLFGIAHLYKDCINIGKQTHIRMPNMWYCRRYRTDSHPLRI